MRVAYNMGMLGGKHRAVMRHVAVYISICGILVASVGVALPAKVGAAQIMQRSLHMPDPTVGATTSHSFTFSYTTTSQAVGSIMFEYCTSPLEEIVCDSPVGMNATGAVLADQQGEQGYFILTAQTHRIILTRAPALPPSVNPSTYTFTNIQNPTSDPGPFYVRITTYTSTDATGAFTDFGAVVASTTQGVLISTEVPPYLKFCVGLTITGDCATAEGSLIDLGDLTTRQVATGKSEMMAATNADFGLVIAMYGTTMTSGNNIIEPLATPTVSAPGNSQFGINLRNNSNPDIGQDPSGGGIATPTANYNIPNRYTFNNGDIVATSPDVTDTRKFTTSYITNISPSQPPGVYTATLTYICTATF